MSAQPQRTPPLGPDPGAQPGSGPPPSQPELAFVPDAELFAELARRFPEVVLIYHDDRVRPAVPGGSFMPSVRFHGALPACQGLVRYIDSYLSQVLAMSAANAAMGSFGPQPGDERELP